MKTIFSLFFRGQLFALLLFVFFLWTFWTLFVIITFLKLSGAVSLIIVTHPTLGDYDLNKLKSKLPEEASTQGSIFWLNSYR